MKWIIAIIQPHQLDAVRDALMEEKIIGLTVTDVKGFGRQKGQSEIYRGAEYHINYVPKLKVEIGVEAASADRVVNIIMRAAQTGRIGDGKIFVMDLASALRIRTGEEGADAL